MLKRWMVMWGAALGLMAAMAVSQTAFAAEEAAGDKKNGQQAEQKAGSDKKAADDKSSGEEKEGTKGGSEPDCQ